MNYLNFHVGYHRLWNNSVSVRHPSLWTFVRCLKDQQGSLEVTVDAANRGDPAPRRKRKWRDLEARLLTLKEQYVSGARNLGEYWDAVCHCIVSF